MLFPLRRRSSALQTYEGYKLREDDFSVEKVPSSERFQRIQEELVDRYIILETANRRLDALNYKHVDRLAATDVFIEKAQQKLTVRARWFFAFGVLASIGTVSALLFGTWYVGNYSLGAARAEVGGTFDGSSITLLILRGTTVTAYILGAAYVCFNFAKALFHEGTNSLNRRHALRFGRLYVYLTEV